MDSHITWPYQIADHHCRITWVYNKIRDPSDQNQSHGIANNKEKKVACKKSNYLFFVFSTINYLCEFLSI